MAKTGNGRTFKGVTARTPNQKRFIQAVNEKDFVFLNAPWGSGKTILSIGLACEFLKQGRVDKVIFVRSSSQIIKDYGYSTGDYKTKSLEFFNQHIEYFEKFLGKQEFQKLWNDNVIELTSTSIIRGRNFERSIVILDEAQHSSKEDLVLFLSRISVQSKAIIMGDENQNGGPDGWFGRLISNLEDNAISIVTFTEEDILRHKDMYRICKKIIEIK